MKALKIDISRSDGKLDAKGPLRPAEQRRWTRCSITPAVEATLQRCRKASLSGFDFVRALQSPSRDGVQGGKDQVRRGCPGSLVGGRHAIQLQQRAARLPDLLARASASGELLPNRDVNGRAYVELRSSSNVVRRNTSRITGNLKAIVLRP